MTKQASLIKSCPTTEALALSVQVQQLLQDLSDLAPVIPADQAGERYTRDWTGDYGAAAPVVRPRTPQALAQVLQRLWAARVPVVVQGGMTGLVGGGAPRPGEVVLSTELLREIEACDLHAATMTVQAGVTLQEVQEEAERHGLFYPVDLGARGSCTIAGNIATNAGGNRVLQYGMTRASVLGLEVVLPDGTCISRLRQVVKDNAGFDLKQLFIGSEGALGVVTRAVLRLQPLPRSRSTVLLGLHSLDAVLQALVKARALFGPGLTSFEVMWQDFMGFVTGQLGIGRDPFDGACSHSVLLEISSFDGNADREHERLTEALATLAEQLDTEHMVLAQSLKDAHSLWQIRDASGEAARALGAYLSFDISIPVSQLQDALARIDALLRETPGVGRRLTYGHLGDGNLHLLVGCSGDTAREVEAAVYAIVTEFAGSISAEHGIGLSKAQALVAHLGEQEVDVMRRIKSALDPHHLLNAGRVIAPPSH